MGQKNCKQNVGITALGHVTNKKNMYIIWIFTSNKKIKHKLN